MSENDVRHMYMCPCEACVTERRELYRIRLADRKKVLARRRSETEKDTQ